MDLEKIIQEGTSENAKKFVDSINQMKSYHQSEISFSERLGTINDYSGFQEQRDLENYRMFMNSSAYDSIKDVGNEMPPQKKITLNCLRKIGLQHEE